MRILQVFAVVLGCVCFSGEGAESKSEGGWRTLPLIKDGKVHPDWKQVGYGGMAVEGEALRTECVPEGLGLLVYGKERLGNCQVRVVFKAKDERANAGVYVRLADGILDRVGKPGPAFARDAAGTPSEGSMATVKAAAEREEGAWFAVHRGYEVQIAGAGDDLHRTGAIYSLAPSKKGKKGPGEWQTMIITLKGTEIAVELDGEQVSKVDTAAKNLPERKEWHEPKREPKRPEAGYLGLQNHDPGDVVWFKEVSVRALR